MFHLQTSFGKKPTAEQPTTEHFTLCPLLTVSLVVGSSKSIVANTTVGWALKLDREGNLVWNKTFLEGFGTELRYAVNLTDGFLACRQRVFGFGRR